MIINVILSGGSGTRLWPLSTKALPKQYLNLFEGKSLFELTLKRNASVCSQTIIVSSHSHIVLAREQAQSLTKNFSILAETVAKNTAPAIAFAAFHAKYDDILLVTPSDHLISNSDIYLQDLEKGKELANNDRIVTFGIKPQYSETGYGYIQFKENEILRFTEKPTKETAESYLKSGDYLWNSGIFMFKAGVFLNELLKHAPQIYKASYNAYSNRKDELIDKSLSELIPSDSIDYAIMEKTELGAVVPSSFSWTDLGSFDSLAEHLYTENSPNSEFQNVFKINSQKEVYWLGADPIILVETNNKILIMPKGESQKVKNLHKYISEVHPELL